MPTETERDSLKGQTIADAVTSHSFAKADPNGYKHRERNRERFALVGALGMWSASQDRERTPGPDLERRMRADQHYAELTEEIAGCDARLRWLDEETRRAIRRMATANGSDTALHVVQARKWELEHDYLLEVHRRSAAEMRLSAAREELVAAYAARVPVPINWFPERADDELIRLDEAAIRTRRSLRRDLLADRAGSSRPREARPSLLRHDQAACGWRACWKRWAKILRSPSIRGSHRTSIRPQANSRTTFRSAPVSRSKSPSGSS